MRMLHIDLRELIRRGYVVVDERVTDPVQRTALLMLGVKRWVKLLPAIRRAAGLEVS